MTGGGLSCPPSLFYCLFHHRPWLLRKSGGRKTPTPKRCDRRGDFPVPPHYSIACSIIDPGFSGRVGVGKPPLQKGVTGGGLSGPPSLFFCQFHHRPWLLGKSGGRKTPTPKRCDRRGDFPVPPHGSIVSSIIVPGFSGRVGVGKPPLQKGVTGGGTFLSPLMVLLPVPSSTPTSREEWGCQWPLKIAHFWPSKIAHFWPLKIAHIAGAPVKGA